MIIYTIKLIKTTFGSGDPKTYMSFQHIIAVQHISDYMQSTVYKLFHVQIKADLSAEKEYFI